MSDDDEKHSSQPVTPAVGVRPVSWPMIRTQSALSKTAELHRGGGHVYALQGKKSGNY